MRNDLFKVDGIASSQFHVDHLKQTFNDFARTNLYRIKFNLPVMGKDGMERTEVLAKAVNFPTFEISRMDIKRMGEKISLPASQNYSDLQFTLLCDDAYGQRNFLHDWLTTLVYASNQNVIRNPDFIIKSSITVYQLDNKLEPVFGAEFTHVFPTSIGEIQMSYESVDMITEFQVSFAYSQYVILKLQPATDSGPTTTSDSTSSTSNDSDVVAPDPVMPVAEIPATTTRMEAGAGTTVIG